MIDNYEQFFIFQPQAAGICPSFFLNTLFEIKWREFIIYLIPTNLKFFWKGRFCTWTIGTSILYTKFNILMCTCLIVAHFKSIFILNYNFYGFGDMKKKIKWETIIKHVIYSCYYNF